MTLVYAAGTVYVGSLVLCELYRDGTGASGVGIGDGTTVRGGAIGRMVRGDPHHEGNEVVIARMGCRCMCGRVGKLRKRQWGRLEGVWAQGATLATPTPPAPES